MDFSFLNVQLLPPERWNRQEGDQVRDQRCLDAFVTSLTRVLRTWCLADLTLCKSPWTDLATSSKIVLLFHSDLSRLRDIVGDGFDDTEKVVFCPDSETEVHVQGIAPGPHTTTILGPIMPRKIVMALSKYAQKYRDLTTAPLEIAATSVGLPECSGSGEADSREEMTLAGAANSQKGELSLCQPTAFEREVLPIRASIVYPQREPYLLLVDDNAINLKVLGMFAKKCIRRPAVSAGGGREAIERFRSARDRNSDTHAFDIILLDLSMPEVSGFQVAATIRELEHLHAQNEPSRTYIVALTGLVSDKDRDAAFVAGVDEYVTKPASLADLQNVVENWRKTRDLP